MQVEVCKCCSTCKSVLPVSCYSKSAKSFDGFQCVCKSCASIKRKQYYAENKSKEWRKAAEWRADNKEKVNAISSAYRKRNPEKVKAMLASWYAQNKTVHKANLTAYAKANPDKINAISAKRRATKLNATPSWLTENHHTQMADIYWLAKDLETISGESYHVDHIVPLQGKSVCGLHVPWNLQVLPATENIRKNNKYDDWKDYAYQ